MIEGGSRVISSFLRAPLRDDGTSLVNSVVITVAPTFIGEGVGMVPQVISLNSTFGVELILSEQEEADDLPTLIPSLTETMGKDVVTICSIEPRSENKRTPSR